MSDISKIYQDYLKTNQYSDKIITGFSGLDKIIYELGKTNLYVLGGRPGMGKTTLGLNILYNIILNLQKPALVITYEMIDAVIVNRLLAIGTNIPYEKIVKNQLSPDENELIDITLKDLDSKLLFIESPSFMPFDRLKKRITELRNQSKIEFILLDDIQRITISDENRKYAANREQEVSDIVRSLKALAKEIQLPILAISQLNRDNKDRIGFRPILTDIRDSGAIENDADVVVFLHRPEYYGVTQDDEGNSLKNLAKLIVSKNRHGSIGETLLKFDRSIPRFSDIDDQDNLPIDKILDNKNDINFSDEVPF